jgi:hypothetical protein
MDDKRDDLQEERAFWNVLLQFPDAEKRQQLFNTLVDGWVGDLPAAAAADFRTLCDSGCSPLGLVALLALSQHHATVERFITAALGKEKDRKAYVRHLETAAAAADDLFLRMVLNAALLTVPPEERRGKTEIELPVAQVVEIAEELKPVFTKVGHLPPTGLASELRFYVRLITFADAVLRLRSREDFLKYAITGYVRRATQKFHDEEVVSLIAATLPESGGYRPAAHRMWRKRKYRSLDTRFSGLPDLINALAWAFPSST